MTTKELIDWAMCAEDTREKSWNVNKYNLTISEAVKLERGKIISTTTDTEENIVVVLLGQAWNEVQDWYEEFSKL